MSSSKRDEKKAGRSTSQIWHVVIVYGIGTVCVRENGSEEIWSEITRTYGIDVDVDFQRQLNNSAPPRPDSDPVNECDASHQGKHRLLVLEGIM